MSKQNFALKKFWAQKKFGIQKRVGLENAYVGQNILGVQKNFWSPKMWIRSKASNPAYSILGDEVVSSSIIL